MSTASKQLKVINFNLPDGNGIFTCTTFELYFEKYMYVFRFRLGHQQFYFGKVQIEFKNVKIQKN